MTTGMSEPLESPVRVYVEVTDTVSVPYTTGIQRVVRELVARLGSDDFADIDVVPIYKATPTSPFRRLTRPESERLVEHPPGGVASRRADSFGILSPLVRSLGDTRIVYRIRIRSRHIRAMIRERRADNEDLQIDELEPGSIFLDMEGSWFDPEPRTSLLPRLGRSGVTTVTMVHDVMPILFPEWFADRQVQVFNAWMDAHLEHSRLFLTNSARTTTDLEDLATERKMPIDGDVVRLDLGADFSDDEPEPIDLPSTIGRFLLVVGTVEPRKNHRLVLDAWERVMTGHPELGLVIVGKEGWMVDELTDRIRNHDEFGRRLMWLGGIDDRELVWLYRNAFLTIVPSFYEGLGVPVVEALLNGCPVICSTGGALPEAGGGVTELIDPHDTDGLIELLEVHLSDAAHHERVRERITSFTPPTWEVTAEQTAAAIRSVARTGGGPAAGSARRDGV